MRAANSDPILLQPAPIAAPYPTEVAAALAAAVEALRAAATALPADPVAQVAARRMAADLELLAPALVRRLVEADVDSATSGADS